MVRSVLGATGDVVGRRKVWRTWATTWLKGLYLEVHGTYNLLSNCSYNPIISRVTVVMGLIFGL